jgi:hypothetical protein
VQGREQVQRGIAKVSKRATAEVHTAAPAESYALSTALKREAERANVRLLTAVTRAAGAAKRATALARTTGRRAARKRGSEREAIVRVMRVGVEGASGRRAGVGDGWRQEVGIQHTARRPTQQASEATAAAGLSTFRRAARVQHLPERSESVGPPRPRTVLCTSIMHRHGTGGWTVGGDMSRSSPL